MKAFAILEFYKNAQITISRTFPYKQGVHRLCHPNRDSLSVESGMVILTQHRLAWGCVGSGPQMEGALRAPGRRSGGQRTRQTLASPESCLSQGGLWGESEVAFGMEVLGVTTPLILHAWGQGRDRKGEAAMGGGAWVRPQEKKTQGGKRKRGGDSGVKGRKGASRTERRKQIFLIAPSGSRTLAAPARAGVWTARGQITHFFFLPPFGA